MDFCNVSSMPLESSSVWHMIPRPKEPRHWHGERAQGNCIDVQQPPDGIAELQWSVSFPSETGERIARHTGHTLWMLSVGSSFSSATLQKEKQCSTMWIINVLCVYFNGFIFDATTVGVRVQSPGLKKASVCVSVRVFGLLHSTNAPCYHSFN